MKRNIKFLSLVLALILTFSAALPLFSCNPSDTPNDTDQKETTTVPPEQEIKLSSLTFDDASYSVSLDGSDKYTVSLPAGRSRIPLVSAAADDGITVEVIQAVIPDSASEGDAVINISNGEKQKQYTVTFKRDASLGFHLQYDDYYTFTPNYTLKDGENFTFTSSNQDVASVDAAGTVRIVGLSDAPVKITAEVNGVAVDELTVDKAIKAPIDIFCLIGQSDADGVKGNAAESDKPLHGTAYYIERTGKSIVTLSNGRQGFGPALSKKWYELTGTKVTVIQGARDASRIATWVTGGSDYENFLTRYNIVKDAYTAADSKYEIRKVGYIWHHGETDMANKMAAITYYNKFTEVHNNILKDTDCTFGLFNIIRSTRSLSSKETLALGTHTDMLPIRAAYYTINADFPDVMMSTRYPEAATIAAGYIYKDDAHYTQKGYNLLGLEIVDTMYKWQCVGTDRTPTELEVLAYNGRDKYSDGDVIEVTPGTSTQIAAIVLPLYNNNEKITFSSSSTDITINQFGLIWAQPTASEDAIITVSGGGFTIRLTVKVKTAN